MEFYRIVILTTLPLLAIALLFCLIRAIRGPRIADRIVGVNMIGTIALASIAVLAWLLDESWLLDVSLIYCLISFLTVAVLAKNTIASHEEDKQHD